MEFTVRLNGTTTNPFHQWELSQNPFPQIAKYENSSHLLYLQKLGAEPIPNVEFIREYLKGWSEEFIRLCCDKFKKGECVVFDVHFESST